MPFLRGLLFRKRGIFPIIISAYMAMADKEFWKRARSSVFAGASALLVFSTAHADVVVLKNGDRISGDLLERGGEHVTVSTS